MFSEFVHVCAHMYTYVAVLCVLHSTWQLSFYRTLVLGDLFIAIYIASWYSWQLCPIRYFEVDAP